jgi:cell division cycle protein 20 (cofactor of APC complex)
MTTILISLIGLAITILRWHLDLTSTCGMRLMVRGTPPSNFGSLIYRRFFSGEIQQLMELESPEDYVCSVKWIKEGNVLAVGNLFGDTAIWDVEQMKKVRTMPGHTDRVGALSWNEYVLSSGSRAGKIHHSDVRVAQHLVGSLSGHSQEVCGLAWSPDGKMLASGGNDNVLNLWPSSRGERFTAASPLYSFT